MTTGPYWSAEPAGYLGGPVGEDDPGTRTADRGERLHDDPVPVQPPVGRGRLQHRVLAADLVGGHGQVHGVGHAPDDVEIGQGGLHHHDVGALADVQQH